jgi:hypothetical protein
VVIVYQKNGEKAPMLDANEVRIEKDPDSAGLVLRCRFNGDDAGYFRWDEVSPYSITVPALGAEPSNEA